jgi:sporulation protein YlmC with PRC-barrel domain
MKKGQSIKLFSELRDLEIFDRDGILCGIVDDVEFEGEAGAALRIKALLVGPGAYRGRMPNWAVTVVHKIGGDGVVHVPWGAVEHVTSRVTLNRSAADLGLGSPERRLRPFLAMIPCA